jgi:hypothetical protein
MVNSGGAQNLVDFTKAFMESNGEPISYQGRTLRDAYELSVTEGERLEIAFERATPSPVQGIGIGANAKGVQLETNDQKGKQFVLWADTAPPRVEILVRKAKPNTPLRIWNVWRDEKYGMTMYGVNAAAIEVCDQSDGSVLLRCSDGWKGPDFEDLHVAVRRLPARASGE